MQLSISKQLKHLRKQMNMNQFEFAKFLSIKQPTLSAYERDISNPSLDVLLMISEKCHVSLDWLCGTNTEINQFSFLDSIADVIRVLSLIKEIDGLSFDIQTSKKDIMGLDEYTCSISFTGKLSRYKTIKSQSDFEDDNFSPGAHLCKFLYDWKKIEEELDHLSDKDLKAEYYKMWLDKQLKHYSQIPFTVNNTGKPNLLNILNDMIDEVIDTVYPKTNSKNRPED